MNGFASREKAMEGKFQHDKMLEFKINARRNHLFGKWVAENLNLEDEEQEAYAKEVIAFSLETPRTDAMVTKVMEDLKDVQSDLSEAQVRKQLDYFQQDAAEQILKE